MHPIRPLLVVCRRRSFPAGLGDQVGMDESAMLADHPAGAIAQEPATDLDDLMEPMIVGALARDAPHPRPVALTRAARQNGDAVALCPKDSFLTLAGLLAGHGLRSVAR